MARLQRLANSWADIFWWRRRISTRPLKLLDGFQRHGKARSRFVRSSRLRDCRRYRVFGTHACQRSAIILCGTQGRPRRQHSEKMRRRFMQKIITSLWFDNNAEEAAKFYVSIFKNSKIGEV